MTKSYSVDVELFIGISKKPFFHPHKILLDNFLSNVSTDGIWNVASVKNIKIKVTAQNFEKRNKCFLQFIFLVRAILCFQIERHYFTSKGSETHCFVLDYYILGNFNELADRKQEKTDCQCVT